MLLPKEQIYRDRTFDELLEDDFTKELFDSISSSEGVIIWRDSISNFISAEEQYAVLFNTCYYIVNEIRLNPRPHLRLEEYESFIETLKWSSFLLMPDCKELIFTIIYYIVSEVLRFDDNFCRRIRLRASQEIYNLIFFKILYFEGRNLVEKILPQPELDTQVLACNTFSKSDLNVSPFWGNSGMGTILDDLESQIAGLKDKNQKLEEYVAKLEAENEELKNICEEEKSEEDITRLSTLQLIILFESLLNVPLKTNYTNINALSELIAKVSGYKKGAVRTKLNKGVDYDKEHTKNDVRTLISLLEHISKEYDLPVINRLKENIIA